MATDKRERQRAGRIEKTAAQLSAAKREKARATAIRIVVGAVVVLGVLFGVSRLMGDDSEGDDTATDDTAADDTAAEPAEFAYGTTPCPPVAGAESATLSFDDSFEQCIDPAAAYTATFETSEGDVVVALDTERTPGTTNNFVALARNRYYDGTQLFRTDPSIGIIQGGSPHSNDASDEGPGYSLPDEGGVFEFTEDGQGTGPFTYEAGQLIMARSGGPDGAGAQFFFGVDENVSNLDSQGVYVVFGEVVEGLDVLESILALHEAAPDNPLGGAPSRPVTIETVTITES